MKSWLAALAQQAEPDIDECITRLGGIIPRLHDLVGVAQDKQWHAEGDVYIHTGMVLQQLYALLRGPARHIQGEARQALILGALLHDVGKVVQTRELEIRGVLRLVSPRHEAEGRSYLTFRLMELPLSFEVIYRVLGLVGEHQMPKLLVVKNRERRDYLALSRRADVELLYWLEVADMRGRICPDLETQLDYLEQFCLFAEEYRVWQQPHQVYSELQHAFSAESPAAAAYLHANALYDIEQGLIALPQEALARHYQHKNRHSRLTVLCGPSGAGKSSWIARDCPQAVLISLDMLREEVNGNRADQRNLGRILQLAKQRLKAALRQQQDVVWDATNLRYDFRKIVCDLGRDYHALVTLVVFVMPMAAFAAGNRNRHHQIPHSVLLEQLACYEFPTVDEAHRVLYLADKGRVLYRAGYLPTSGKYRK